MCCIRQHSTHLHDAACPALRLMCVCSDVHPTIMQQACTMSHSKPLLPSPPLRSVCTMGTGKRVGSRGHYHLGRKTLRRKCRRKLWRLLPKSSLAHRGAPSPREGSRRSFGASLTMSASCKHKCVVVVLCILCRTSSSHINMECWQAPRCYESSSEILRIIMQVDIMQLAQRESIHNRST